MLQTQALRLPEGPERTALLTQAVASITRSLAAWRKRNDEVNAAMSLSQLGQLHLYLGDLATAETHLHESRAIRERLGSPEVWKDYANLEQVAEARGNPTEAAAWRAKKEAKQAELEQLAGPPRLDPELLQAFAGLCQAIAFTRQMGSPLPADAAEAIAQLAAQPDPLGPSGRFLDALAQARPPPPLPDSVPTELHEMLAKLADAFPPKPGTP